MTENVYILIVVGLAIAVVVALLLNRRLRVQWGNKKVETGGSQQSGTAMSMTASGKNSKIERARQVDESGSAKMDMKTKQGGQLIDVDMQGSEGDSEK